MFVNAERTRIRELHLVCVSAMVSCFFDMDRWNLPRWLPMYMSYMRRLVTKHPEVHEEFVKGSRAVSRSSKPFNQVWTDMALEQSINTDYQVKRRNNWYFTKPRCTWSMVFSLATSVHLLQHLWNECFSSRAHTTGGPNILGPHILLFVVMYMLMLPFPHWK